MFVDNGGKCHRDKMFKLVDKMGLIVITSHVSNITGVNTGTRSHHSVYMIQTDEYRKFLGSKFHRRFKIPRQCPYVEVKIAAEIMDSRSAI